MSLIKNTNNLLLEGKNLSVVIGGKKIIDDVSLSIFKNDFITIIGPNGAGKSMLLKCLLGFYRPNFGVVDGKKNIKIGYVPQRLEFNYSMPINVKNFIVLGKKINQKELDSIINDTQISELLNLQISELSGGQMQRVLLARSLLNSPELLILDEPAQNLDIKGQLQFYKLLQYIYEKYEIAILMVSHDLHMVMSCSKQVLCLYHHICCSGSPKTILKNAKFEELFGSEMKDMMAIYQHNHNHSHKN